MENLLSLAPKNGNREIGSCNKEGWARWIWIGPPVVERFRIWKGIPLFWRKFGKILSSSSFSLFSSGQPQTKLNWTELNWTTPFLSFSMYCYFYQSFEKEALFSSESDLSDTELVVSQETERQNGGKDWALQSCRCEYFFFQAWVYYNDEGRKAGRQERMQML